MGRRFEYEDEKSNKFWEIEMTDLSHTVRFGKIGTRGQEKTREFDSSEKARASYDKLIAEKLKKGYVETGESSESPEPEKTEEKQTASKKPEPVAKTAEASVETEKPSYKVFKE